MPCNCGSLECYCGIPCLCDKSQCFCHDCRSDAHKSCRMCNKTFHYDQFTLADGTSNDYCKCFTFNPSITAKCENVVIKTNARDSPQEILNTSSPRKSDEHAMGYYFEEIDDKLRELKSDLSNIAELILSISDETALDETLSSELLKVSAKIEKVTLYVEETSTRTRGLIKEFETFKLVESKIDEIQKGFQQLNEMGKQALKKENI